MNYEKTLIVRLTKQEHDKVAAKAKKKGLSISQYVRKLVGKL